MIDFHAHILPNLDDGAKSYEIALDMLRESRMQGVSLIISTSHCYPRGEESVDRFIQRRDERLSVLREHIAAASGEFPDVKSGCELNLYCDISKYQNLRPLCIEGTNYLLVEMPYTPWEEWIYDCIYTLSLRGLQPVIAHIDRYLDRSGQELSSLFDVAPFYQVNAEALLSRRARIRLAQLFRTGRAHILGSDMHNLHTRRPRIKEAAEILASRFGPEYLDYISKNAESVIQNRPINQDACRMLPKTSRLRLLK